MTQIVGDDGSYQMAAFLFLGLPIYILMWSWIVNRYKEGLMLANPYLTGQSDPQKLHAMLWLSIQTLENYGLPSQAHETVAWLSMHKKICTASRRLLDDHKCRCSSLTADSSNKRLAYLVFEQQLDRLIVRFPGDVFLQLLRLELNVHRSKNLWKAALVYKSLEGVVNSLQEKLAVRK